MTDRRDLARDLRLERSDQANDHPSCLARSRMVRQGKARVHAMGEAHKCLAISLSFCYKLSMQPRSALEALGDSTRLQLLRLLAAHPSSVQGLSRHLGVTVSAVSQQLRILRAAGLVTCEAQGHQRVHSVAPDALEAVYREAAEVLGGASSEEVGPGGDRLRTLAIQRARALQQFDMMALLIAFRVERLVIEFHKELRRIALDTGLSPGDIHALGAIASVGPPYETTPTQLKAALWLSLPGIGSRLDGLEARGLIRRTRNPDDRRGWRVRLTERGLAALARLPSSAHVPSHVALRRMSPRQRFELERLLHIWQKAIADAQSP